MAITKTLAVLKNKAVKESGIVLASGTDNTKRHDTTDTNGFLNDSYRAYMTLLTTRGFDFFLVETAQAALPTTRADTNEQYSLAAWPNPSLAIKRVDVYSNGEWNELTKRDWTTLRSEAHSGEAGTATRPLVWAPKSHGSVSGATLTAGTLAFAPFSSNGKYKVTYLPEWTDITNDLHLFLFADEWGAQWVIWDYVIKIAVRDNDAQRRYVIAKEAKKEAAEMIGHFVPVVTATGPDTVVRSREYRR